MNHTKASLRSVILLSKNVSAMSSFFTEVVGLRQIHGEETFAELRDS